MRFSGARVHPSTVGLRSLRGTALGMGVALIGLYLFLAILRLGYPFELEWMEGGIVDEVRRLMDGRDIYVEPSIGFVPFVYPPLYFDLAAALASWFGDGFLPARLVSVSASIGCLLLIFHVVRRRTSDAAAGLLAAGLFAACYRAGGAWLDIARPDSLALVLALCGLAAAAGSRGWRGDAAAGLLLALACLAKQSALFVAAAVAAWWILRRGRAALPGIAALIAVLGASTAWLQWRSSGWYLYYVWQVPRHHPVNWERLALFWRDDLLALLPGAILFGAAGLAGWHMRSKGPWNGLVAFGAGGLVLSSWLVRVRTGSYDNVLLPAFAGVALLFGLGLHATLEYARSAPGRGGNRLEALIWLACILQFLMLTYDPRDQLPRGADREAGQRLVQRLRAIDGSVYVPAHGFMASMAGKPPSAHWIAVLDVLKAGGPVADRLRAQIESAVERQEFAAVVADRRLPPFLDLDARYVGLEESPLIGDDDTFWPVTGYHTRPERLLVPIRMQDRTAPAGTSLPQDRGRETNER